MSDRRPPKGRIIHSSGLSWDVDRRKQAAAIAVEKTAAFARSCAEVEEIVRQHGPWATALRLTKPLTKVEVP